MRDNIVSLHCVGKPLHVICWTEYFFLYLAIDMVQIDAGHKCYAQALEAEMHFPIIIFILAVAAGIGLGLFLDKKTKEGYTEIEVSMMSMKR